MIIFKKIKFANFLSFYNEHEYEFKNNGIHWIKGLNLDSAIKSNSDEDHSVGSGKSSFTFVIQYALFGDIEKKLKKKDKVINKDAKKNLEIELYFECDKNNYRIRRYRKHDDYDNNLYLEMFIKDEWQDISSSNMNDTQEEINKLIILTSETFLKSILFSREDDKQFFKLINSKKIEIFENIIQLNKFDKYIKRIKSKLKKCIEQITNYEKEELASLKAIKIHTDNKEQEEKRIKKRRISIKNEIEELKENHTNIDINDILIKIKAYKEIQQNIKDINREKSELQFNQDKCDIKGFDKNIKRVNENIEKLEQKIKNYKPIVCKNCNAVQNELEFNEHVNELNTELFEAQSLLNKFILEKELKTKDLIIIEQQMEEVNDKLTLHKEKLNEIDIDKTYLNMDEDDIKELKEINNKIILLENELKTINDDIVKEHEEKIIKEQDKYDDIKEKLDELKKHNEMLIWWQKALDMKNEDSIKSYIMSKVIPVFNKILQDNIDKVFSNTQIFIDELLNESIIKDDEEYDYSELSTGEKNKVNLCTNFSIFDLTRMNLTGSNLLFLDEIFNNMDAPTTKNFIDLIEEKYSNNVALYTISHDKTVEKNIIPQSITLIKKQNNKSYIELV